MIKYLNALLFTTFVFINIGQGQDIDSVYLSKIVNNYVYNISESSAYVTNDSLLSFHFDNDTIVIDVLLKFEVEFDTIQRETEPMGSGGTIYGSYANFLGDIMKEKIYLTNDSLIFGKIDSSYFFHDTLTSENFAMLHTAAYNIARCYEYQKGQSDQFYAISYSIVRKDFFIIAFGNALVAYKNEIDQYMNALIDKYEASYIPY